MPETRPHRHAQTSDSDGLIKIASEDVEYRQISCCHRHAKIVSHSSRELKSYSEGVSCLGKLAQRVPTDTKRVMRKGERNHIGRVLKELDSFLDAIACCVKIVAVVFAEA